MLELGKGIFYNIQYTNLDCEGEKQGKKANKKDIKQERRKERSRSERKMHESTLSRKIFFLQPD